MSTYPRWRMSIHEVLEAAYLGLKREDVRGSMDISDEYAESLLILLRNALDENAGDIVPIADLVRREDYRPTIVWCAGDVPTVRPDWDEDKCKDFLAYAKKSMIDRSVEMGWGIMSDLADMYEEDQS